VCFTRTLTSKGVIIVHCHTVFLQWQPCHASEGNGDLDACSCFLCSYRFSAYYG
jgi:hypothetical protein